MGRKGAGDVQPVLIVTSEVPGALYLNGRYAGEVGSEAETALPIAPRGPILIEHRPLVAGYLPMARRLTLSGGRPIALTDAAGVEAVAWPGGAIELLLTPEPGNSRAREIYDENGLLIERIGGALAATKAGTRRVYPLPDGARDPEIVRLPGALGLRGECGAGAYLIALGDDGTEPILSVFGREASFSPSGEARALEDMDDLVGHARLTRWELADGQFTPVAVENFWTRGAPEWPTTPEGAALAALQAARLGLMDEARSYLAPGATADALDAAAASGGALPLKYPLADGRPAVGLIDLTGDWLAIIRPVYYHASPLGGPQGVWRLDRLALE